MIILRNINISSAGAATARDVIPLSIARQLGLVGGGYGVYHLAGERSKDRGDKPHEVRTKERLEKQEGIKVRPLTDDEGFFKHGDWIDEATGLTYDAFTPPSDFYDFEFMRRGIERHRLSQAVDYIVLDVSELSPTQAKEVLDYANSRIWPAGDGYPRLLIIR